MYKIQKTNRRRKSGGTYLSIEELRDAVADVYRVALSGEAAEAFGGCYTVTQLSAMVDRNTIIDQAIALILSDVE